MKKPVVTNNDYEFEGQRLHNSQYIIGSRLQHSKRDECASLKCTYIK